MFQKLKNIKSSIKLSGEGSIYIIFMLAAILGISYFLTDGVIPAKFKSLVDAKIVEIDLDMLKSASDSAKNNSTLQLNSFSYCKTGSNFQYVNQIIPSVQTLNSSYTRLDGVGINSKGNIIISVQGKRLQIYDKNEKTLLKNTNVNLSSNGEHKPYEIAIGADDRIYVLDDDSREARIYSADASSILRTIKSNQAPGGFGTLRGIAVDKNGVIAIADAGNDRVLRFTNNGAFINSITTANGINLKNPSGLHYDSKDNLYIVDEENYRVVKLNNDGTQFITSIGSQGAGDNQFARPDEVAIDANDNVYVADVNNNRVMVFDSNGTQTASFGKSGNGKGELSAPWSIDVNDTGRVFVSDTDNNRVEIFDRKCTGEDILVTPIAVAPTPPPIPTSPVSVCTQGKLATELVVDRSNSITEYRSNMLVSLELFKDRLQQGSPNNLLSVVSFADNNDSKLDIPLNRMEVNGGQLSQIIANYTPADGTDFTGTLALSKNFVTQVATNYEGYTPIIIVLSDMAFNPVLPQNQDQVDRIIARFIANANEIKSLGAKVYLVYFNNFSNERAIQNINSNEMKKSIVSTPLQQYVIPVNGNGSNLNTKINEIYADVCN